MYMCVCICIYVNVLVFLFFLAGPPHKVQCLSHHFVPHHEDTNTALSSCPPPPTPSRPALALGTNLNPSRHPPSLARNGSKPTAVALVGSGHDLPQVYHDMPSPPSPPQSPPVSPVSAPLNTSESSKHKSMRGPTLSKISPYKSHRTPRNQCEKERSPTTPSLSKYRRALDLSTTSPDQETSQTPIMERFNALYQSLTSPPTEQVENELNIELRDGSRSPVLDRSYSVGVLPSSGVLMRAPACPYITVTGSDGARVYLKLRHKVSVETFGVETCDVFLRSLIRTYALVCMLAF